MMQGQIKKRKTKKDLLGKLMRHRKDIVQIGIDDAAGNRKILGKEK